MNIISKAVCSISVIGLLACGGSSPKAGTGPGFPAGMTAKKLFLLVSANLYVPNPLSDDETYTAGTANCTTGGKAKVVDKKAGNQENSTITFTNCASTFGSSNIALKQNGTVHYFLSANDINNPTRATFFFRHELSYSGDIGFAADCEFTVKSNEAKSSTLQSIDGSCTYTDSKGKALSLNGTDMLDALKSVIMFATNDQVGSAIGDRASADALCQAATPTLLAQTHVRAFLSYTGGDDIASMPKNYSVPTDPFITNASGDLIADNWADLLDGTIGATLDSVGVSGSSGTGFYWTGSTSTGALSTGSNCDDWTNAAGSGMDGYDQLTNSSWIENDIDSCANAHPILCIAF